MKLQFAAILAAEISAELVPVENGEKLQSTEAAIGRYELQYFSLARVEGCEGRRVAVWIPRQQAARLRSR